MAKAAPAPKYAINPATLKFAMGLAAPAVWQGNPNQDQANIAKNAAASGGQSFWQGLGNVGSRLIDILSRPQYSIANAAKTAVGEVTGATPDKGLSDIFGSALTGFEGKDKTSFSNVIQEYADIQHHKDLYGTGQGFQENEAPVNPWVKGIGGFIGDVGLDPTTYLGVGTVKDLITAPIKAIKGVEEATHIGEDAAKAIDEGAKGAAVVGETPSIIGKAPTLETIANAPKELMPAGRAVNQPIIAPAGLVKGAGPARSAGKFISRDLPKGLRGAPPGIKFEDGVTHALSAIGRVKASANEPKYLEFLRQHLPGLTDEQLKAKGREVNATVTRLRAQVKGAPVTVPLHSAAVADDVVRAAATNPQTAAEAVAHNLKPSSLPKSVLDESKSETVRNVVDRQLRNTDLDPSNPHWNLNKQRNALREAVHAQLAKEGVKGYTKLTGNALIASTHQGVVAAKDRLARELAPHIEDTMISLGKPPVGVGHATDPGIVRLSDLIAAVPQPKGTSLLDHVNNLVSQATGKITPVPAIAKIMHDSENAAKVIRQAKITEASRGVANAMHTAPTQAQAMEIAYAARRAAINAGEDANQAVKDVTKAADPRQSVVQQTASTALKAVENQRATLSSTIAVRELLRASMDGARMDKLLKADESISDRTIGKFFNTASGMRFLAESYRTMNLGTQAFINVHMQHIMKVYNSVGSQKFDVAFNHYMRGLPDETVDPAVAATAQQISNIMENIVGNPDLEKMALAGTTDATRVGISVGEMNSALKSTGKGKYVFDVKAKGTDWLHSWRQMEITNPLEFMSSLASATTSVVSHKLYFAGIASLPGVRLSEHAVDGMVTIDHVLTKGMHFEPRLGHEVQQVLHRLTNDFKVGGKGWRVYDDGMRMWKTAATVYNPVHHAHNLEGDMFLAYMDGVTSPKWYARSLKVMRSFPDYFPGVKPDVKPFDFSRFTNPEDLLKEGAPPSTSKVGGRVRINGKYRNVDMDTLHVAMRQTGLLPVYSVVEDLPGEGGRQILPRFSPFGGKVHNKITKASEAREHYVRIAHFLYSLEKGNFKSLDEAFSEAAKRVRKWHPTGDDLTQFERSTLRRVFPFYSWTRKAIPLVLESLAMRPGKSMAYFDLQHNIAAGQGINQPSVADQFPTDQMFPEWMRLGLIGPNAGQAGDYQIVNPSVPTLDVLKQLFDPRQAFGSQLTPSLRVPFELASQKSLATGVPIKDTGTYLNQQVPLLSTADRITNTNVGPGNLVGADIQTPTQQTNPSPLYGLLNWLTGAGALDTSKYIEQAKKEAAYNQRQAAKGK